jgi:hypothetical protein
MALRLVSAHCCLIHSGPLSAYGGFFGDPAFRRIEITLLNGLDETVEPGLLRLEGRLRDVNSAGYKITIANGWSVQPAASLFLETLIREAPAVQTLTLVDDLEFAGRVHPAQGMLGRGSFGGLSMIEGSA